ncbi:MAG: hypothetical protein PHN69_01260 [Candidatus Pacebacteria bacterium]|nr:hypothetical protein [Candidatus Paceibacterota bacterium]
MKKLLFLRFILICFFFVISSTQIFAEPATCFDYYKFQSVHVNVGPEKPVYKTGDTIIFSGTVINQNDYPIFDGYVFVRISEVNPSYITEGHNVKDEFMAIGPLAIDASSSKQVNFSWNVPARLKNGSYKADYFFSVDKKFNLGGLPFTNEITIGFSNFDIISAISKNVSFDKSSTKVNGGKYLHIGNWPMVDQGDKTIFTQNIVNTYKQSKNVEITYDLYFWDSLNEKDLISTKSEKIILKAGETKELTYEISEIKDTVYYLKMTAKTDDGAKSIVNMRVTSSSEKPRVNYFGLNKFPLKKGDVSTIFSCFHNSSGISTEGRVSLIAKDIKGNNLAEIDYNGRILSSVSAEKINFDVLKNLKYVKLEQKIYDKNGVILDSEDTVYDCSLLDSEECKKDSNYIAIYILVALLIIFLSLFLFKRNRDDKKIKNILILINTALFIILLIVLLGFRFAGAQTGGFSNSQNLPSSINYSAQVVSYPLDGNVTRKDYVTVDKTSPSVRMGDVLNFTLVSVCDFNLSGGFWDTPSCGQDITINNNLSDRLDSLYDNIYNQDYLSLYPGKTRVELLDKLKELMIDIYNDTTLNIDYTEAKLIGYALKYDTSIHDAMLGNKYFINEQERVGVSDYLISTHYLSEKRTKILEKKEGIRTVLHRFRYDDLDLTDKLSAMKFSITGNSPNLLTYSSNPNVINCTGSSCRVVGAGSANITVVISNPVFTFKGCAYIPVERRFLCNDGLFYVKSGTHYSSFTLGSKDTNNRYSSDIFGFRNGTGNPVTSLTMAGSRFYWNFVAEDPGISMTFTSSTSTISSGSSATLSWTTNADNCNLSLKDSSWNPVTINPTFGTTNTGVLTAGNNVVVNYIYTLSCAKGIRTSSKDVTIYVKGAETPVPIVNLYRTDGKTDVYIGDIISLAWDSQYSTDCSASVDWSGIKNIDGGPEDLQVLKNSTYSLTCSGNGGDTTGTINVPLTDCSQYSIIGTSSECIDNTIRETPYIDCSMSEYRDYGTPINTGVSCSLTMSSLNCYPEGNFIKDVQNNWLIEVPLNYTNPTLTGINITHGQETILGNKITIPKIYTSTGEKTFQATTTALDTNGLTYTGTCTATTTVSGGGGATGQ